MATINLGPCECCGSSCKFRRLGYETVTVSLNTTFQFAYPAENPHCEIFSRSRFNEVCSSLNGTYVFDLPESAGAAPVTFSALESSDADSAYSKYGYDFRHDLTVQVSCDAITAKVSAFYTGNNFQGYVAALVVRYAFYTSGDVPIPDPFLADKRLHSQGTVSVQVIDQDTGLHKSVERIKNYPISTGINSYFWIEAGRCNFLPTTLWYDGQPYGPRVLDNDCLSLPPHQYHAAAAYDPSVLSVTLA